jgi:hypothetical protein
MEVSGEGGESGGGEPSVAAQFVEAVSFFFGGNSFANSIPFFYLCFRLINDRSFGRLLILLLISLPSSLLVLWYESSSLLVLLVVN